MIFIFYILYFSKNSTAVALIRGNFAKYAHIAMEDAFREDLEDKVTPNYHFCTRENLEKLT